MQERQITVMDNVPHNLLNHLHPYYSESISLIVNRRRELCLNFEAKGSC